MQDQELRKLGLKVTVPRLKILRILEQSSQHHLSPEEIYQALRDQDEDVGLATVYRVLAQFEAAGLVTRHYFEGGVSVFEINQGEHHDHLVCVCCGKVEEFIDEVIEKHQEKIAVAKGFRITDHSLIIYGLCPHCDKTKSSHSSERNF